MPEVLVKTKFFEYRQNNSGGCFDIDDEAGIGPRVWIEATDVNDANRRAQYIGIYFDGVFNGVDCPCCGDRWNELWEGDGEEKPVISPEWDFNWHNTVYVHRFNGEIVRIRKEDTPE